MIPQARPAHRNGVAPDDCAGTDDVEVCIGAWVGAVVGSHAARTTTTGSDTMSLRRTNGRTPLDFKILPSRSRVRRFRLLGDLASKHHSPIGD